MPPRGRRNGRNANASNVSSAFGRLVTAKGYADLAGRQERKWIVDGRSHRGVMMSVSPLVEFEMARQANSPLTLGVILRDPPSESLFPYLIEIRATKQQCACYNVPKRLAPRFLQMI